ncbi:MAG: IS982 family transposase [Chloroflexota bacterium]
MDDTKIITAYCIIADTMHKLDHKSHPLAGVSDAEVLTVAVVSAMYFQNHHERALFVMKAMRYISKPLSISRFSRRLHALAQWLEYIVELLGQLFSQGEAFIIDSLPIPVCKSVRAYRCRKLNGPYSRAYLGRCAAKKWRFFGWRLHLICTPHRVPVCFQMLPASFHDLSPIYELTFGLPAGAAVYADKAYISAPTKRALRPTARRPHGVKLVALHRKGMKPNTFEEWCGMRLYLRQSIETANSQLVSMGIQSLDCTPCAGQ